MDNFENLLPTDEDIKNRENVQSYFFEKYSNRPDEHVEGYIIDDLLECFKAAGDTDEKSAVLSDDDGHSESEEEAIESDDSEEIDRDEGALGYSEIRDESCNRHDKKENNNSNKQLVLYKNPERKFKFLEKNYGSDFIAKAKKAYMKRCSELDNLNLRFWKRSRTYESFNESNLKTPNFHASSKSFVRATEQNCASFSKALSPTNLFKVPEPVNLFRNNISLNGFPAFQGSFNFGSGDSTLPLPLQELINQSQRRFNLKIREMHYDLSVDACDVTSFFQPNQTNAIANMSGIQAIENGTINNTFTNLLKQIDNTNKCNNGCETRNKHENSTVQLQKPSCDEPNKKHTKNADKTIEDRKIENVQKTQEIAVPSSRSENHDKAVKKSKKIKNSNDNKKDQRSKENMQIPQNEKPKTIEDRKTETVQKPQEIAVPSSRSENHEKVVKKSEKIKNSNDYKKDQRPEEKMSIPKHEKPKTIENAKVETAQKPQEIAVLSSKSEKHEKVVKKPEKIKNSNDKKDQRPEEKMPIQQNEKPKAIENAKVETAQKPQEFAVPSSKSEKQEKVVKKYDKIKNSNENTNNIHLEETLPIPQVEKHKMSYSDCVRLPTAPEKRDNNTPKHHKKSHHRRNKKNRHKSYKKYTEISFSDCSAEDTILIASGKKEIKEIPRKSKEISENDVPNMQRKDDVKKEKETEKKREILLESNKMSETKISENSKKIINTNKHSERNKPEKIETKKKATNERKKYKKIKQNCAVDDSDTSMDDIDLIRAVHAAKKNVNTKQTAGPKIEILSEHEDSDDVMDDMEFFRNAFQKRTVK